MIVQGIALYVLFSKFYAGGSLIREGLTLGMLVGVFALDMHRLSFQQSLR